MSDADAPAAHTRRRATVFMVVAVLLLAWSFAARQWSDKGCGMFPKSYGLVVTHFGTPDHYQGCDEYGDYTDNYGD